MAYTKFKIEVPKVNNYYTNTSGSNDYSKSHIIQANKRMINSVGLNYNSSLEKWSKVFDIDKGILISFICTESAGKNAPTNRFKATGLMQVTPSTIFEVYTKWSVAVDVPLSSETKKFFENKVSTTKSWVRDKMTSVQEAQILSALKDTDYNIACGTAVIRWMLEAFSNIGVSGIDKVMASYNAGYYGMRNKIKNLTTEQILKANNVPSESKGYILKMLGVNGFMDLYYNKM